MLIIMLMGMPFVAGTIAFLVRHDRRRRGLLVTAAVAHFCLICGAWGFPAQANVLSWFALDPLGLIVLTVTSLLFLGAAVYGTQYLEEEAKASPRPYPENSFFSREAVFTGCLLLFLSAMTVVIASQHVAVLWVAIEATTLVSAPLIYFHRTRRSLEATWKYLLICSVGIALALLGIFFLAAADLNASKDMLLGPMISRAAQMSVPWLKAAFLFLFVGYATKMGLAPFHTWLPDAHSESPSVVSALLSGALLNCAFVGILRGYQICIAAGLGPYCREIFIVFGLLSVVFAAFFILRQEDYKRMLAYSSVEHMGVLALGLGLGAEAVVGALISLLGHALTKAGLFFIAGNILWAYKTKKVSAVQGLLAGATRGSGILWLAGFLLITATPPSGIFWGQWLILKESLGQGHYGVTAVFLSALIVIFIGMARIFISMAQGTAGGEKDKRSLSPWDAFARLGPSALFFVLAAGLGVYIPGWLVRVLQGAARQLGGF